MKANIYSAKKEKGGTVTREQAEELRVLAVSSEEEGGGEGCWKRSLS